MPAVSTDNPTKRPRNSSSARRDEQAKQDRKRDRQSKENRNFVQIYPLGFRKLQMLMQQRPKAARFYALLMEHIDSSGVVVATQDVLAEIMDCSVKTIQRYSTQLEECNSLVRIQLQGGVYAYALNPEEVWRAYDSGKEYASFHTKTLVSTRGHGADIVRRKLQMMVRERSGEPELPGLDGDE